MDIGTTGVDEKASVMFNYIGGQSALLLSAIRVSTTHEAAIYGDAGYIKLPVYWCGSKLILNNKDGTQEFDLPYEATGYQFEAIEAMECLEKGLLESPRMTLKETLEIMETLDQIRADNNLKYPFE
jgi:predicted dehydrogenase